MASPSRWLPKSWIRRSRIEALEDRRLLASFQGLGNLPGGIFYSVAHAVSADGSTVVGESHGGNYSAFRWTETGGMANLGDLAGGDTRSSALAVSADGSVIVGQSSSTLISTEAFRWSDGVMVGLGDLPGGQNSSTAFGVSANGGTIVGGSWSANGTSEAFRTSGGNIAGLGDLEGGSFYSQAWGVSADGSVIAGIGSTSFGGRAARYSNGEWETLGILPGGSGSSEAYAVSGDGSTIVGKSVTLRTEAFRVVGDSAMQGLGDLDGGDFYSVAKGVSQDGSVIVGHSATGNIFDEEIEAFRWTAGEGMRSLRTLLQEDGVDMTGWKLISANGVSADGTVIVGEGINPNNRREAWRVVLGGVLSDFTNTDQINTLSMDISGNAPAEIAFYVSADGSFDENEDSRLLKLSLSAESISTSELLVALVEIPGGYRLTLNPAGEDGEDLKLALEDEDVATIFAVADPDQDSSPHAPFRGFYQEDEGSLAVLRTGPDSKDIVTISMDALEFTAKSAQDQFIASKSTSRGSINQLLVMTSELNDIVDVSAANGVKLIVKAGSGDDEIDSGSADDVLDGGVGSDTYWFREEAGGDDVIRETGTELSDRLDFTFFPKDVEVALDHAFVQQVAPGLLTLKLEHPDLIENVTGSDHNDFIRGNDEVNRLIGKKGNDILVGKGGGSSARDEGDELFGDEGDDILLGDGFNLTPDAWSNVKENFTAFIDGGELGFSLSLSPSGDGGDIIVGGAGDDLIIGGDGDDTITAGEGKALIFGDAFQVSVVGEVSFSFNFKDALSSLSLTQPLFALDADAKLIGNGKDTITGGQDFNVVIGGDGDDIISGGRGVDVLLGNKGEDTIDGLNGLNFIVGGDGADKMLKGGTGINLILGDSLRFDVGLTINPAAMAVNNLGAVTDFLFGVSLDGASSDDDKIQGGTGHNVIIGGPGNDTIEGGNSGSLDLLFGNDGRDTIRGHAGPNVIVGGSNTGDEFEIIEGGEHFNVILGDDYKLKSGLNVGLEKLLTGTPPLPSDFIPKMELDGVGKDKITLTGNSTNIVLAGAGDDEVSGSSGPIEFLFGNEGSDTIRGNGGVDVIIGGAHGDALLDGGADPNVIFGDSIEITVGLDFDLDSLFTANPVFSVTAGFKLLDSGADNIVGGPDFDFLVGGDGGDDIDGGDGLNIVFGDGFEVGGPLGTLYDFGSILAKTGEPLTAATIVIVKGLVAFVYDFFAGSEGNEGDQLDHYFGGNDVDIVFGGGGPDKLEGKKGFDFLVGGDGADTVDAGKDSIGDGVEFGIGGEGDDTILGSDGVDLLFSTAGSDRFFGRGGDDFVYGGDGDDELHGEEGNDSLFGEAGNDFIDGGTGADMIYAGPGNDSITPDPDDQVDDPVDRLPGDTNLDGAVDIVDLNNVRNNFGYVGTEFPGDVTDDGVVGIEDLNAVRNNFGTASSGTPSPRQQTKVTPLEAEEASESSANFTSRRTAQRNELLDVLLSLMGDNTHYIARKRESHRTWKVGPGR